MLVGVVAERSIQDALQQLKDLKGRVDLAEIRLDYLEERSWPQLSLLKEQIDLPLLFTFRKKAELSEEKRLALFEEALSLEPAFADIEADTDPHFIQQVKQRYPQLFLIGSFHDFHHTPSDLPAVLAAMRNDHFSFYKIAVHARSTIDLMRLMVFARNMSGKIPLCCISMGPHGQPSRVLGPIVGNALHYTSLRESLGPLCQYSLDTLQQVYHFSHLTKETKIYALLGEQIEESRGQFFHNEIFHREGKQAVYIKLRLTPPELSEFFTLASHLPFGGFSVRMPLKEELFPFLTQVDPQARAIGAVNTLVVRGKDFLGYNTDGLGALDALEEKGGRVAEKKLAILGAGGSARAIAYEALQRGAEVMIFNRSSKRAEKAAADLGCKSYPLDTLSAHPYDYLVNTIPAPASGQLPILAQEILPQAMVMDINFPTLPSPLLQAAKERGISCIDGSAMFEKQALLQQQLWAST